MNALTKIRKPNPVLAALPDSMGQQSRTHALLKALAANEGDSLLGLHIDRLIDAGWYDTTLDHRMVDDAISALSWTCEEYAEECLGALEYFTQRGGS